MVSLSGTQSPKAFGEATWGKAHQIRQKAEAEGRQLSASERGAVDALEGFGKAVTGAGSANERMPARLRYTVGQCRDEALNRARAINTAGDELSEHEQGAFDALIEAADTLKGGSMDTFASGQPMPSGWTPPGHPQDRRFQLLDEQGRCVRTLSGDERFEDVARELAGRIHDDVPDGAAWVDDGLNLGGMMRAMVLGPQTSAEKAALSESGAPAGGYNVPTVLAGQVIDLLPPNNMLFRAGSGRLALTGAETTWVKVVADPTVGWRHEENVIAESRPTLGAIVMRPKSMAAIVLASRELLEDGRNVGNMVQRSLTRAMGVELDRAGMYGTGSVEPLGLMNEPGVSGVVSVGTIGNYTNILDAYKLLLDDNVMDPTGLIMSNREWRTYAGMVDSTGQPLRRPEAIQDLPFYTSSAVPTDEGDGGNESRMLLGYFPDNVFGIRTAIRLEVLRELYAKTGQYAFVAHMRVDRHVLRPQSFCKIEGITTAS
ncbi:MAG: phage major capsid protein [Planctomycetota bacterium]